MGEKISYEDASSMYTKTVVQYKKSPVLVVSIDPNMRALIRDLATGVLSRVNFDLDDFTNLDNRLGYINFDIFSIYLKRKPMRIYKVGLTTENMEVNKGDFKYEGSDLDFVRSINYGLTETNMADTLLGRFPSFAEVYEKVRTKESRILAFDRQFALSYKGGLYYRGKQVGAMDIEKQSTVDQIRMVKGYESLSRLIGGNFKLGV